MMRWSIPFLLATAAAASAQPGWQPPLNAVQATNVVARCLAREQEPAAIAMLDLPLMSEQQSTAGTQLLDTAGSCASGDRGLQFTTLFMAGGMAEQLLLTKYVNVEPDIIKLILPTVEPRTNEEDLALCFAEKWPAETRAIIATSAGSPGEAVAVDRILPQIGSCVPAGMTMRFNPATIRALAAFALYRVASQVEAGLLKIGRD